MSRIIVILIFLLSSCSSGPTLEERMVAAERNDRRAEKARENADLRQAEYYEREAEKDRNYQYKESEKTAGFFDLFIEILTDDD